MIIIIIKIIIIIIITTRLKQPIALVASLGSPVLLQGNDHVDLGGVDDDDDGEFDNHDDDDVHLGEDDNDYEKIQDHPQKLHIPHYPNKIPKTQLFQISIFNIGNI